MTFVVELRCFDGDLSGAMIGMRAWLDHKRIETERFDCCSGCPGLAFRIDFKNWDHAASFAAAFGGGVQGTNPEGAGMRWTRAPSARETDGAAVSKPPGRLPREIAIRR